MKMKFENVYTSLYSDTPISKVTYETDNQTLDDILEDFEMFLKACGFHITGTIQVVEDE